MNEETNTDTDYWNLCRICIESNSDLVHIYEESGINLQLEEKINHYLPISVSEEDKLPLYMCVSCINKLNTTHELIVSCIESNDRLTELLNLKIKSTTSETELDLDNKYQKDCSLPELDSSNDYVDQSVVFQYDTTTKSHQFVSNHQTTMENPLSSNEIVEEYVITTPKEEILDRIDGIDNASDKINGFNRVPDSHFGNSYYENFQIIKEEIVTVQHAYDSELQGAKEKSVSANPGKDNYVQFNSDEEKIINEIGLVEIVSQNSEMMNINEDNGSDSEINTHTAQESENLKVETFLSCEYCRENFIDVSAYNNHMQLCKQKYMKEFIVEQDNFVSDNRPWLCDYCGKRFTDLNNLRVHKRNHLDENLRKKHKCEICSKGFRSRFLVQEHMTSHTGERPFLCDRCPKSFPTMIRLKQHINIHMGEQHFHCSLCSFSTLRRATLVQHYRTHVAFQCRICHKHFPNAVSLYNHQNTHSKEEFESGGNLENSDKVPGSNVSDMPSFMFKFQCSECGKFLSTKASLYAHKRIHAGIKPYMCTECGSSFSQKPALIHHRRIHTGERPFSCQFCGKGFSSKNGKDNHERVHTGEKPFQCSTCGVGFRCSANLRQHEVIHEGIRAFPCSHCEKKFRRREALIIHMRIHTGERPYSCYICKYTFTQKGDMKKHVRSHYLRQDKQVICSGCNLSFLNKKQLNLHICEMETVVDKN